MHEGEHRSDQDECEDDEWSEEVTFEEGALQAREGRVYISSSYTTRGWLIVSPMSTVSQSYIHEMRLFRIIRQTAYTCPLCYPWRQWTHHTSAKWNSVFGAEGETKKKSSGTIPASGSINATSHIFKETAFKQRIFASSCLDRDSLTSRATWLISILHYRSPSDKMALTRAQRALAAAPQPAQNNPPAPQNPQPAPQQQARPQKPNKKKPTQKKDKAFVPEDDEDANGEGKEDAAPAPKSGRKRPSPAASAVSSSKARKTGDAGPSGRNTPGPGLGQATDKADRAGTQPEELDEAGGAVVEDQGKGKGKGNGKGKEKAVEDTSEVSAVLVGNPIPHVHE